MHGKKKYAWKERNRNSTPVGEHNGSLLRRQPGAAFAYNLLALGAKTTISTLDLLAALTVVYSRHSLARSGGLIGGGIAPCCLYDAQSNSCPCMQGVLCKVLAAVVNAQQDVLFIAHTKRTRHQ